MKFDQKHEMIRKLVRQFAETELTPEILDEVEETGVFPQDIQDKMAKCGFYGIKVPQSEGGQGVDSLAYVIMLEELCRVSAVASLYANSPNSLGGGPLLLSGTPEQKAKYLRPTVTGEKIMAFALTEPGAGSDAGSMTTTAVKDGEYWILNGRKTFITMAPLADYAVVYAKTDMNKGVKGITAFIVDMKAPGVSCGKHENKMGLVGCATSDIVLEDVRVHDSDRLGKEGMGFINAMKTLDGGRLGVAAQSIGVAQGCLDEAIKFAKERKQVGRPIAKDTQADASMECAMAKYFAAETCNEIAAKAVQIHGGYGFMNEYRVSRHYRDSKILEIGEGTSEVQLMLIARELGL